jgi:hypothetical protein
MRLWLRDSGANYYDDDGHTPMLCADSFCFFLQRRYPQYNWDTLPSVIMITVTPHPRGKFRFTERQAICVVGKQGGWAIYPRLGDWLRRYIGNENRFNACMEIIRW